MIHRELTTGLYKHLKESNDHGECMVYLVHNVAEHTETGELMVHYQAMYGDLIHYVRPLNMFMSRVDKHKYPLIDNEYRFNKMRSEEINDWVSNNSEVRNTLIEEGLIPLKREKTLTFISV